MSNPEKTPMSFNFSVVGRKVGWEVKFNFFFEVVCQILAAFFLREKQS
jgi:hypothetical protein